MNKHIISLAKKSGLIQYESDGKIEEVKKFAELIVKECVTIMTDASDSKLRLSDAIWNTKIHFGVE